MKKALYPKIEGFLLADQGSNLDSSEPKSDVLPVTPSANFFWKPDCLL